jgi:hypothetical protein
MKIRAHFQLLVMLLASLLLLEPCRSAGVDKQPVTSEHAAAAIAEAAFLESTGHEVTSYSIHARKHTAKYWWFQIEGKDQFDKPGYHWTVSVDRATGKTKVLSGQ